jgi:DNA gyrase subunit B
LLERLRRRLDIRALDAIVRGAQVTAADLVDGIVNTTAVEARVRAHLEKHAPETLPVKVTADDDASRQNVKTLTVHTVNNGAPVLTRVTQTLVDGVEYQELLRLARRAELLGEAPYVIEKGQNTIECATIDELVGKLDEEARRGHSIQRYKGLGEMNPNQLWETTMNPTNRTLLQVKIEDAVEADQIFTDLMGDEVEPRKLFIERVALDAINLDI